jgi:hypothetical protein
MLKRVKIRIQNYKGTKKERISLALDQLIRAGANSDNM